MKKSLFKIVTLGLFFIFASAYTNNPNSNRIGFIAPNFEISNGDTAVSLQHMKGKYVLLTFWSSDDAESRIANIQYDRATGKQSLVDYVAVNYDRSEKVYSEIIKNDSLRAGSQFHDLGGKESKLYASYQLDRGLKSYLLNPEGKIIAENPTVQQIRNLKKVN